VTKQLTCSCGYVACGADGDELLADVEAHIGALHADLFAVDRVAQVDDEDAVEPALASCSVETFE
jgi:hypothetical protein